MNWPPEWTKKKESQPDQPAAPPSADAPAQPPVLSSPADSTWNALSRLKGKTPAAAKTMTPEELSQIFPISAEMAQEKAKELTAVPAPGTLIPGKDIVRLEPTP